MLTAPFIIFASIVLQVIPLCKSAAILPLNVLNGALDLAQHHLGDVAGRAAQLHDRIKGIEVENVLE